jgi:hypothetical protein
MTSNGIGSPFEAQAVIDDPNATRHHQTHSPAELYLGGLAERLHLRFQRSVEGRSGLAAPPILIELGKLR